MQIQCYRTFLSILLFIMLIGNLEAYVEKVECKYLPTYFSYDFCEIDELSQLDFLGEITHEEIEKWDAITRELLKKYPGNDPGRIYAYLYVAQKEAAFLSYNAKGYFVGSLAPISQEVLSLFFPTLPKIEGDEYSKKLAAIVFLKIKERFELENSQVKNLIDENDSRLKEYHKPYIGLERHSYIPWILENPKEFLAKKPPLANDPFWVKQSKLVENISKNCSEKEREETKYWAGKMGQKSGNWYAIATDYMIANDVPLWKILFVRAFLAEAGFDVDIAVFYSKYSYLIKRPSVVNPSISPLIAVPNHPSYPSGHSTWSSACAIILAYFFPENSEYWFEQAKIAGFSRICGGIHYPIDNEEGRRVGSALGQAIIASRKICL